MRVQFVTAKARKTAMNKTQDTSSEALPTWERASSTVNSP